jgi:hypothetical protein
VDRVTSLGPSLRFLVWASSNFPTIGFKRIPCKSVSTKDASYCIFSNYSLSKMYSIIMYDMIDCPFLSCQVPWFHQVAYDILHSSTSRQRSLLH